VRAETRVWFNPDLRSRSYYVPGVIVNIVGLVTVMLTAMAIVREKEIGTMEQLMVTPIRPVELVLGKTLPFAVVGLFNMATITALGLAIFRVPLRGSLWMLAGSTVLFLMTTLGSGLFLSTISRSSGKVVSPAAASRKTKGLLLASTGAATAIAKISAMTQVPATATRSLRNWSQTIRA
jgi:ABC-type multidrug transport system permease subunit